MTDVKAEPKKTAPGHLESGGRTRKAGLCIPIHAVRKRIRASRYSSRISKNIEAFLAGVVEYVIGQVMEVANEAADDTKRIQITSRCVQLGLDKDQALRSLFSKSQFAQGGVVPEVHPALLRPKKAVQAAKVKAPPGNPDSAGNPKPDHGVDSDPAVDPKPDPDPDTSPQGIPGKNATKHEPKQGDEDKTEIVALVDQHYSPEAIGQDLEWI